MEETLAQAHQVSLRDSDVLLPGPLAVACGPACSTPSTISGYSYVPFWRCVKLQYRDIG